jgi:hypothetical protein
MTKISGYEIFELDIMKAIMDQLIPILDRMEGAELTKENAQLLPAAQGVYQIIHRDAVKYIGKTDAKTGLRLRMTRHWERLLHRDNIAPTDVQFRAVRVLVMTAVDVERELISHYRADWNNSGFGSNDPGRERETTGKPAQSFDGQYPINIDLALDLTECGIPVGNHSVHEVLWRIKEFLPFTLRYETTSRAANAYKARPHPDYVASTINIPHPLTTLRALMGHILSALPNGWQATTFVSHVILYKETRSYEHGAPIARVPP